MSKKIKRDKMGHAILPGAILYKYSAKPKYKRTNTTDLKNQASERLLLLLKKGATADRLAQLDTSIVNKQERKALDFQREYAESPKIVQFAHHNNKLKDLEKELKNLKEGDNKKKFEFMEPLLKQEIAEQEEILRELYREIKNERLFVSRVTRRNND